jgi:hypothetical protein
MFISGRSYDGCPSSMRSRADTFLEGLLSLHRYEEADRRAVFRQSIAALARTPPGQSALEGCDEAALARGVSAALADGLFDDLGWLAAPAAAAALYQIANALPLGAARRELGRMVLEELYEGDAATFVAIATRMASGGAARALSGPGIKARLALALALPPSADVRVDPLALAVVSRRELCTAWLGTHAIGSLPERRMAGRLLERAAREAAERARVGDTEPALLFHAVVREAVDAQAARNAARPDTIEGAWRALFEDRETLVWRHVACARGLLSRAVPALDEEIRGALSTRLTPTEWRRAATSLAASIAVEPERSTKLALEVLKSPLLKRDPTIATAMLWGLGRAADAEPEAAASVLDTLSRAAPLFIAEDLLAMREDIGALAEPAAERCAIALADALADKSAEEDMVALMQRLYAGLRSRRARGAAGEGATRPDLLLAPSIERAVDAFVESGSREAFARARIALEKASETVDMLEALHLDEEGVPKSARSRSAALVLVRELDVLVLETGVLQHLVVLRTGPGETAGSFLASDALDERLARWLLQSESVPLPAEAKSAGVTAHQRKLRALLHLIDAETMSLEDDQGRRDRVQDRWTATCRLLLTRLAAERATPLRRAVAATVARSLDALVRDGAADPADALLYAAHRAPGTEDLTVLAQASMNPEVWRLLCAYVAFIDAELGRPFETADTSPRVASLEGLTATLPQGGSQRIEALRNALLKLARALGAVKTATALRPLADPDTSPLVGLSDALERLGHLTASALRRCGGEDEPIAVLPSPAYPLTSAVARALKQGGTEGAEKVAAALTPALTLSMERAFASIPRALAGVVARILPGIAKLPLDAGPPRAEEATARVATDSLPAPSFDPASLSGWRFGEGPLPAWMPSRRTIGGFYVHQQIGGGAAGSVFIVTRAEERHDPDAERFALKVPDYDATAARSLSETDFLKLFREEAGALLAVPEHKNLARFVTFDAGARPKPILVMELVSGSRCDKLIASRLLTMEACLRLLDGVLAGLLAMHGVGVGHLDVKPSNVILRDGVEPVLVDFGLAGRHLRPGCGTSSYGAPEVWGFQPPDARPTPMAADVYSFGCLAYEVLTGETLFDAPNEVALISAHLVHDGSPGPVKRLADKSPTSALAGVLRKCLRKSPEHRGTVSEIRAELRKVGASIATRSWPVPV